LYQLQRRPSLRGWRILFVALVCVVGLRSAAQNPPPSLTSISPASGPLSGGTAVVVTGANFLSGASLNFGSAAATNVAVVNAGTITATTPASAAGAVNVMVTNPDGQSSTLTNGYSYNPAPTLSSLTPPTGSVSGGTSVTLSGSNFLTGATVTFGSVPSTFVVVVNSSTITATAPAAGAGTVNVTVTNPDGQSATLSALVQPLANPGFESGASGWTFAGTGSATVINNSAQAHTGSSFAQLNSPAAGNHPMFVAILASGNSQYLPVNPGDVITFGGWTSRVSGDGTAHWVLVVVDANKANPVYISTANVSTSTWTLAQKNYTIPSTGAFIRFETEIFSNTVPAMANFDDGILVRTVLGGGFTYLNSMNLGWIGPESGPANVATPVSITGTNFTAGSIVTVAGVQATNVTVVNSTLITAITPALPAGPAAVVVTSLSGQVSTPILNYVFNPPPSITGVAPATGSLAGGTTLSITGANFLPGARVTVGGASVGNVVVAANTITATTAAHAAGAADVVVTNPDGQSSTASGAYTFLQPPPSIAVFTPVSGSSNGGNSVVISGANFLPSPIVNFGGVPATVTAANSTSITVLTPAGSAGAATVSVTNTDGQSGSASAGFNYVSPTAAPTLSSISSLSGPTAGGASVTLTGTNFVAGAGVTFGGVAATNVAVANSGTITAATPAHSAGEVNVTVTNPDGQSASLLGSIPLLLNPSFESGSTDWLLGSGSGSVVFDPANAEDGNQYLLLASNAGSAARYFATDASGTNEYFPVAPGDVITFGGSVYRLSGDGSARFKIVTADAKKNVKTTVFTTPPNAANPIWGNLLGTYTVPAGTAFVQFAAQIDSNTVAAQARFDAAVLQRSPAGGGYTYTGPNVQGIYTHHYDNLRTGQNINETVLTPANVNKATFGKKFVFPVDGWIHAQPLYVANVSIGGAAHNVVYIATEHDSVYAFDADGLVTAPLWQASFINPGAGITTVPGSDVGNSAVGQPEFGIQATPVIDPVAGTIFVLARSKENGAYFLRLHGLDIASGLERSGSPVTIQVSVTGTGLGSVGGQLTYDPLRQNVRPGMVLASGIVYFAAASLEDTDPYHGWIVGYNSQTLALAGVFNATPNGTRGGIWQSGSGIAADGLGNLYVQTGNGSFDATQGGQDYGDSILKVQQTSSGSNGTGLNLVDSFTPYNQAALSTADMDLSSGGVLLLPDQPGAHPHELIGGGKQGTLYVVDRDAMGGFNGSGNTQIVQALPGALPATTPTVPAGLWSTPTYWNNRVYFTGRHDVIKMFTLQNGQLVGPVSEGKTAMTYMSSVVSSNGNSNGILWVLQNDAGNTLHAFDTDDLTREYYNTNQSGTRDVPGGTTRFSVPLVVNGSVYLGSQAELDVYGLLSQPQQQPVLQSISITPANDSILAGATLPLTATGTYSDSSTQNLTMKVAWASSNTVAASVSGQGLVTGVAPGSTTVSATSGSVVGSTGITVSAPVLISIVVSPLSASISVGGMQQFTATGNYSDGSMQNLTSAVNWISSAPGIASISTTGVATGASVGSAGITATSGSISGSASLGVGQAVLVSIAINPASSSIPLNGTQQLTATGTYSDNSTQDLTASAAWTVANGAVVTVNVQGVATGLGIGNTTVTAASGRITGSAAASVALGQVPQSFFGLHFSTASDTVTVPYGRCRIWDVKGAYWSNIEASAGVFNFASLDSALAAAKQAGINDGCVFTLGSTPQWASSNPTDSNCDNSAGGCWPPSDLAFDGTGPDQIVISAITAIASHVNDPTYLLTHAHIRYWEPWNEAYRGSVISGTVCSSTHLCSFNGSYAQLVRLAEDLRATIKAIDPTALITTPSGNVYFLVNGREVVANFLNCSSKPLAGSGCTTGNRGSNAVDVINTHCYVWSQNPDDVVGYIQAMRTLLSPVDASKPFFCDEGGWGTNSTTPDIDLQAGFVARWFVDLLSQQVTSAMWYAWDNPGWGTFWNPMGKNGCTQSAGCITSAGVAYQQANSWLLGATLGTCTVNGSVTTCPLSRAGGFQAEMVWVNTTLASCSGQSSVEVCGSTPYSVPSQFITKCDVAGVCQPAQTVETIGVKPLLLQNQ
jgi:hypothetical protein